MITKQTVLIIGAGASWRFGFPLGTKLVDDILDFIMTPYDSKRLAIAMEVTSTNDIALKEFHDALKYSGKNSIDSFLEGRDEFMDLGKAMIACVLCQFESRDKIFTQRSGQPNWYYYLFDKMGIDLPEKKTSLSNLSIITFNYDRSLEYFLYHAFKNSFRLKADACKDITSKLNLIHFYGLLGELYELNPEGRRFRNALGKEGLLKCIDGINIIREGLGKEEEIKTVYACLERAERVIFLGFGYDRTNLERLNIKTIIHSKSNSFSGSAYGLSKYECMNIVKNSFGVGSNHYLQLDNRDGEILAYLRAHTPFDALWAANKNVAD
jgi:hypothetical protein